MKIINNEEAIQNIRETIIFLKKKSDKEKWIKRIEELSEIINQLTTEYDLHTDNTP